MPAMTQLPGNPLGDLGRSLCQFCGKGEAYGGTLCDECREYLKVFDYQLVRRDSGV